MYECESLTIKKAERRRIDAFELWCWRRLLRVPRTAGRPNQSILKEISPKYSLERLMVKLKLQYFGHLMWRTDSLEKALTLGKIEGGRRRDDRGWDGWMASPTQWTWVWVNSRIWWWTGRPACCVPWGCRVGHNWATELNWVKAMTFPVVMYWCESWTIKKAERWRIDAFGLWCWRRLLRIPWTARRSNQSILNEINPEYSLEGLMLKLKLQYFGHLMWRTDSL